jgi:cytoskeleton protein RodZ
MSQIGEELERARLERGLSLHDVEDATKIRVKYLAALEGEDFDSLPGRVYVIGFLRTYGKFLGLDDEMLVSQYKEKYGTKTTYVEEETAPPKPRRKNSNKLLMVLLFCAVLLVAGAAVLFNNPNPDTPSAPNNSEIETPSNDSANPNKPAENIEEESPVTPPKNQEEQEQVVTVTVNVKEASCWLDVRIDGKNNFRGTLIAVESRTFTGDNLIKIRFGNAGTVEVVTNQGTEYPVGRPGQVVDKEYTINN